MLLKNLRFCERRTVLSLVPMSAVVQAADNALAISVSRTTHNSPPDAFGRIGNRFEVTMQRRIPGTSDDVGWLADTDAGFVITAGAAAPQPPVLWSGTATPATNACALAERVVSLETVAL
jgi:hypothetical protein